MKELKRYLSYIGKYGFPYWSIFTGMLFVSVVLTLAFPYMNKLVFNALEYRDRELFMRAAALCVLLVVLNCLAPYVSYFRMRVVRKIVFDLKIRIFEKLMKMDMNYYESHHSGEALKTLNQDANSLKDSYFSHLYWLFGGLLSGVASIFAMLVYSPALTFISMGFCLASFGTIGVGAFWVSRGRMDYGTVMAIVSLQMSVSSMVQGLGAALATFSASLVKAGRVFDFLESDCEETECSHTSVKLQKGAKPVEIENLTFSYDGKSDVLQDFSMEVMDGEKIMIMGESGCGKSTLLKLLMRFYHQNSGQIKLYGHRVEEYPLWQLRQLITYIPQNNYLFEGSIRENIAFGYAGEGQADDAQIRKAAKSAYAEEFIALLPQGYDTPLEAGGSNLSGGQRQRIAIARAFLKDSPILLMDEPSSALDIQSEKMINQAMKELMKQKVVLMVTHRSASFKEFDRVVRL